MTSTIGREISEEYGHYVAHNTQRVNVSQGGLSAIVLVKKVNFSRPRAAPKARTSKPGVGVGGGQRTGESGEGQEAATPGERRAQGRVSAETLGDDGGSLGSPTDRWPRGFHCFLPPMVYQKRPPPRAPLSRVERAPVAKVLPPA